MAVELYDFVDDKVRIRPPTEEELLIAAALASVAYSGSGDFDWTECTTRDDKRMYLGMARAVLDLMAQGQHK